MANDSADDKWAMKMLDKFKREAHFTGAPYVDFSRMETQELKLKADPQIERGKFRPDPQNPGIYFAHPETIRALRPEIILAGDVDEFHELVSCPSCHEKWDQQFWRYCPHCETSLP